MEKVPLLFGLISLVMSIARAAIYLPCDEGTVVRQQGCDCWNPQDPLVFCVGLRLNNVPKIKAAHSFYLQGNNLTILPSGSFSSAAGLRGLVLSDNKIRTIDDQAFSGIDKSIASIDLSRNDLTAIPGAFSSATTLSNLSRLDLSENYITGIDDNAFSGLPNLTHVYLEKNQISRVAPYAWVGPTGLTDLTFSPGGMDITRIPTRNLQGLQSLSLSNSFPQRLNALMGWFANFPALLRIGLNRMALKDRDLTNARVPEGLKMQLRGLDLSDNELEACPWTLFQDLPLLQDLDLSNNQISSMRAPRNAHFPYYLKSLNLSSNGFSQVYFPSNLLLTLTQAESIDISNNNIKWLNLRSSYTESLPSKLKFRLGNNPWACQCGVVWLKKMVDKQDRSHNGHLTDDEVQNTIRCGAAGDHEGELIKDLPYTVFDCSGNSG